MAHKGLSTNFIAQRQFSLEIWAISIWNWFLTETFLKPILRSIWKVIFLVYTFTRCVIMNVWGNLFITYKSIFKSLSLIQNILNVQGLMGLIWHLQSFMYTKKRWLSEWNMFEKTLFYYTLKLQNKTNHRLILQY